MTHTYIKCMFTQKRVKRFANDDGGIYVLYNHNREVVFVGKPDGLEKCLSNHSSDLEGRPTELAFYLKKSIDFDPNNKVNDILQAYKKAFGKLPVYNEAI